LSRETKAFYDHCFYVREQLKLGAIKAWVS
jgi:hypothetical protein